MKGTAVSWYGPSLTAVVVDIDETMRMQEHECGNRSGYGRGMNNSHSAPQATDSPRSAPIGANGFIKRLLSVEIDAQVVLAGCSLLFAVFFMVIALSTSDIGSDDITSLLWTAISAGGSIGALAYLYSVGPVALVIAPAYAFVEARGPPNLATAAMAGSIPGVAVLLYCASPFALSDYIGALPVACLATGISIASGIYLVRTWRAERGSGA